MSLMNVEITLKNYRCFPEDRPARIILREGFTAFVGINNSGKSSILKFFYEFRNLFSTLASTSVISSLISGQVHTFYFEGTDSTAVWSNTNTRDLEITFRFLDVDPVITGNQVVYLSTVIITIPRRRNTFSAQMTLNQGPRPFSQMVTGVQGTRLNMQNGSFPPVELAPAQEIWEALSQAVYFGPARNAINVGSNTNYFDIQIGQAFVQQWRNLKSGPDRDQNEATYRLTEDIRKIFDYDHLEINPSPDDQTLQLFIDGRSYTLAEVGAGLSQFILVLANAATKRPAFILVDEPEMNLHPSLQLDFLTTLGSYASSGVLFATHSLGLARASAERVYSVQRVEQGRSEVQPYETTPRLAEFVGELSFAGYRDLGFDKILLVEGPREIKTMQQFLRLYGKDHEILLLSLGGASMINATTAVELDEIKRISENVYAIIDSERAAAGDSLTPDRQAFVDNCAAAGIVCHVLERRAIENYLTDAAIKRIKGNNYRALAPFELLRQLQNGWAKADNWRIAREMTIADLEATDLGQFLVNNVLIN